MNDDGLIDRARAAAEREAANLDPVTRQKLSAARRAALEQLERPLPALRPGWLPVGATAAVVAVVVGVALNLRTPAPAPATPVAEDAVSELELLFDQDDPALYDEELEFYEWLDVRARETPGDAG